MNAIAAEGGWLERLLLRAAQSQVVVGALSLTLLGAIFGVAVVRGSPEEPATVAYAVPVALAALGLGPLPGIAAAVGASWLYWISAYVDGEMLSSAHLMYRQGALVFLAVVVGLLSSRLADAEHGAQLQRALVSRAVEMNDTVVQGLALSRYQLEQGDTTTAASTLQTTLGQAQGLVGDLIAEAELEPGALRRARPADVGTSD